MRAPIRQAERMIAIRLRTTISTHVEDLSFNKPAAIGVAPGLSSVEAVSLLNRQQWPVGDIAAFRAWPHGSGWRWGRRTWTCCGGMSGTGGRSRAVRTPVPATVAPLHAPRFAHTP